MFIARYKAAGSSRGPVVSIACSIFQERKAAFSSRAGTADISGQKNITVASLRHVRKTSFANSCSHDQRRHYSSGNSEYYDSSHDTIPILAGLAALVVAVSVGTISSSKKVECAEHEHVWQGEPKNQKAFSRSWENEKVDKNQRSKEDFMVLSGNANIPLAEKIAKHLGVGLSPLNLGKFTDGETKLQIEMSCRGKDIFIIQPTQPPVNDNIMDLLIMISTCRRASAKRITAVLPYYGYGRADRKNASRIPITAADVAKLLEAMGVDRVVAVDLHCGAIQGFFPPHIPMDNLSAMSIGEEYFAQHKNIKKCVVVSPDAGGVYRARRFQEGMIKRGASHVMLAMLVKQRSQPSEIARMDLVGDVRGQDVILVDDMVDTAGTLCEAAKLLRQAGANRVFAFATHGVLSGPALQRLSNSEIEELVVTDSVHMEDGRERNPKIKIVSLGVLLADGLRRIYLKESLSWGGEGPAS